MEKAPFIQVKNLRKVYVDKSGVPVEALRDISFTVDEGELICIIGPSGCGKTTLLKLIAGVTPSTGGTVYVDGKLVAGPLIDAGMVFQTPVLLDWRKIIDNILLPVEVLDLDRESYRDKAHKLIRLVGLEGFEEKYPFELSVGMQQRVSICRALIYNPRVLLMDEPFGALDALTREKLNLEIVRIWEMTRKTILFVTHNIQEAIFLGNRVLLMSSRPSLIQKDLKIDSKRPKRLNWGIQDARFVEYYNEIHKELHEA